jgi:hypothetical protein
LQLTANGAGIGGSMVTSDKEDYHGFWSGRAIDQQLNPLSGEPSNYWISDFLLSDFTTTPPAGTRRLAIALRDAARKAPLSIKQELIAAGRSCHKRVLVPVEVPLVIAFRAALRIA